MGQWHLMFLMVLLKTVACWQQCLKITERGVCISAMKELRWFSVQKPF
jgi:hypothetical protein